MKKVKRFCFGIISSALFTVGLARAADRFDPVMPDRESADVSVLQSAGSDCSTDCSFDSFINE